MNIFEDQPLSPHELPHPVSDPIRQALIRRNKLRHAWRVLTAEMIPIPPELWLRLLEAGQDLERLRGEEEVA